MNLNSITWVGANMEHKKVQLSYPIPSDVTDRIITIANESDIAVLLILLSGVMYFLSRFTNEWEARAVIPVFNGLEAADRPNYFLGVFSEIKPDYGFREWLQQVKEVVSVAEVVPDDSKIPETLVWLNTLHRASLRD